MSVRLLRRVSRVARDAISSCVGVPPEHELQGSDEVVAVVKVDLTKSEGLRDVKGMEKLAEGPLGEIAGREVGVGVEFAARSH